MNMSEPAQFHARQLRGESAFGVEMARHVTWKAGGKAQRVYRPADLADLQEFLRQTPAGEPLLAVGLGSNLLVRDGGFKGTVLLMYGVLNELRRERDDTVYAQSGVAGAKLARFAAAQGLVGAEFFAGIPGTVGGMLAMNAGCYGGETWRVVQRVQVLTRSGDLIERDPQEYEIGYRHAVLRNPGEEFFTGAWMRFAPGDVEAAKREIKALMEKRSASQPLQMPNAGSVFRNPPGEHAARLIEGCGLKGKRIGGAEVSAKHANFIVNAGGATANDIENLIEEVRATVEAKTGIRLQPEVRIVGERS